MFHKDLAGADLHAPTNQIVENNTGSTITALTAVTYNGIGTNFPSIVPANGATNRVRGIVQASINASAVGYVTALGLLVNVNTSPWIANTQLYAGPTGALQTTPNGPVAATVLKQDAVAGVLYVENIYTAGAGSGDVTGPVTSTDKGIARYDGTTGEVIEDSPYSIVQDGGGVQAQAFVFNRQILNNVTVPDKHDVVAADIEIVSGDLILQGDAQLVLI